MSKFKSEIAELSDEELAFEMIEITGEELSSLARAFEMIADLCAGKASDSTSSEAPLAAPLSSTTVH